MEIQTTLTKVKEQIEKAHQILLITHKDPTADTIGSALSLYLGLIGIGKTVSVVCPDAVTVEFSNFVGANKLDTKIAGKKNFIISLDYQEGSIEKVSYNIEGNRFNLVIEPREGFEEFSQEKVHYSRSGGSADLIIAIDTPKLEDLGSLYEENKALFGEKPIINIDRHKDNTMYGAVNVIDSNVSSVTELIAVVMSYSGIKLSEDIATNLLNAVELATDRFQSPLVNARTFEIASVCMKAGGKRFPKPLATTAGNHAISGSDLVKPTIGSASVAVPAKQTDPIDQPPQKSQEEWLKPKIFKNPNSNA